MNTKPNQIARFEDPEDVVLTTGFNRLAQREGTRERRAWFVDRIRTITMMMRGIAARRVGRTRIISAALGLYGADEWSRHLRQRIANRGKSRERRILVIANF
jgi:hypothetical protein